MYSTLFQPVEKDDRLTEVEVRNRLDQVRIGKEASASATEAKGGKG